MRPDSALSVPPGVSVALLTGGGDKPYVFGLATQLISKGVPLEVIGSNELDFPEFHGKPGVIFLNLRGDQDPKATILKKTARVLTYYFKLLRYAATAKPRIFHILWNNKFELFDRTLLMWYYRLLGKRVVLTVHNVNAGRRDSRDTLLNRLTLRAQYRLADRLFVHTEQMKGELVREFGVKETNVIVIPFGINNAVPNTARTSGEARQQLGLRDREKVLLFFGNITPYKGLEYLIQAFQDVRTGLGECRLLIAGRLKCSETYWSMLQEKMGEGVRAGRIVLRAEFIPDEETELYFKAADVLVLPYRHVYQSGVLFLGYSFGLPVLCADVGDLREEVVEGETGFVFRAEDAGGLAETIERYFASDLYSNLRDRRRGIQRYANERYSWDIVGRITVDEYVAVLRKAFPALLSQGEVSRTAFGVKTPL